MSNHPIICIRNRRAGFIGYEMIILNGLNTSVNYVVLGIGFRVSLFIYNLSYFLVIIFLFILQLAIILREWRFCVHLMIVIMIRNNFYLLYFSIIILFFFRKVRGIRKRRNLAIYLVFIIFILLSIFINRTNISRNYLFIFGMKLNTISLILFICVRFRGIIRKWRYN